MPKMLGSKVHTPEQRAEIMERAVERISKTEESIYDIAYSLGISPSTLDRWSTLDEELGVMFNDACLDRAWRYYKNAAEKLEKIQEFYTDYDKFGLGHERERQQSVNKAKFQFESYRRMAADMAPQRFGDRAKELKEMLAVMLDIHKKLGLEGK